MRIDFTLFQRTRHKLVTDVKVIPGEEITLHHQLLVCDMRIDVPPKSKLKFIPCLKVGSLKTIMSNYFQEVFNSHVSASAGVVMVPLRISGTTRLACSRQLRCVAQLGPITGIVKPCCGMSMWKRPLLPRGKISRPGRLVKALGHHTMQPNAFPDVLCTMLIKKPTRRPT